MKKILSGFLAIMLALTLTACGSEKHELKIGQAMYAAHGTKCFALATAVVEDGTIVAAYIDEYQYLGKDDVTGVPNSDQGLGEYVVEDRVLASKRENSEFYTQAMGVATQDYAISLDGIQDYVAGKTITELKELVAKTPEEVVDAVSGATLTDTTGYISAIIEAATAAQANNAVTYEGDLESLTLKYGTGIAHGSKCFTEAAVLVDGETVVLAYIDELQFLSVDLVSVPNAENVMDYVADQTKALASKRQNSEFYTEAMKEAGATQNVAVSYDAIQAHVAGKTIAELNELAGKTAEEAIDAVAGATLADTVNYVKVIAVIAGI